MGVYEFVRAATTNGHRLDGLSNINLFSYSSRSWKSKMKVPVGVVFLRPLSLDLLMAAFSLFSHGLSSVHMHPLIRASFILGPYSDWASF